jgi:hypothetical protein
MLCGYHPEDGGSTFLTSFAYSSGTSLTTQHHNPEKWSASCGEDVTIQNTFRCYLDYKNLIPEGAAL